MGVFTVGRQVALEIDMPGWWLANASVDMDFRRGLYYDSSTANPRAATDFLSCVRASNGYAKTAEGTLTSFSSNVLRITSAGLLLEDARTNYVFASQDFTHVNWTQANVSLGSSTTAPDGTTTAQLVVENSSNAEHRVYNLSVTAGGTPNVYSLYAKPAGRNWISFRTAGGTNVANFNVSTGAIGTTSGFTSLSTEAMAGGWYRCSAVQASDNGTFTINLGDADTGTGSGYSYTGDGSSGMYIWGVQIDKGAGFPSSYILTTSAAATRATDAVTCTGSLNTVFSAIPASVVADILTPSTPSNGDRIIASNGGAGQTLLNARSDTQATIFNGSTELVATFGNSLIFTGGVKVGSSQATAARSIVGGGGTVNTDANTAVAPLSPVYIGSTESGSLHLYAYIRRLTAWNSKLADATLQGFTYP